MTIFTIVMYRCDRCELETESPNGWLLQGYGKDYCDNCRFIVVEK